MIINNAEANSQLEQVAENKANIAKLAQVIKTVYNCTTELATSASTVDSANIRNWESTKDAFIVDTVGNVFNVLAVSDNTIYIEYWLHLPQGETGPQGATGAQGPQGPQGEAGLDAVYVNGTLNYADLATLQATTSVALNVFNRRPTDGQTVKFIARTLDDNKMYIVSATVSTSDATLVYFASLTAYLITGPQGETGPQGAQGPQGPQGVGIQSIEKTGTVDNVDTYTITLTNGTTSTFTVTNAQGGSKLYRHNITFWCTGPKYMGSFSFSIWTERAEKYTTTSEIWQATLGYLTKYNSDFTPTYYGLNCSGSIFKTVSDTTSLHILSYVYPVNVGGTQMWYLNGAAYDVTNGFTLKSYQTPITDISSQMILNPYGNDRVTD